MKTTLLCCAAFTIAAGAWGQQSSEPATPPSSSTSSSEPQKASGTSNAQWLLGNWTFDGEFTQKKQAEAKKEAGAVEAIDSAVSAQLVDKMKGAKLTVTEKEITMTRADGNGKTDTYTVVPGSDPNVVQLKQSDGQILAFHRDGDRIWMTSAGSVKEPFYFKKEK